MLPGRPDRAGKLLQAQAAGARVVAVDGNFDDALRIVRELAETGDSIGHPVTLVNSVNPYRLEGQKTAAFEICDDLGGAPDYLAIPVGNAGNISAYWYGFTDYRDAGLVDTRPVMLGFQAAGAAPIVLGHPVEKPETVATAIRIGNPASWQKATAARDESGGLIDMVTDEEILDAYRDLARYEGVFCEPASAASVAGIRKLAAEGDPGPGGDDRLRHHRARPEGPGYRHQERPAADRGAGGHRGRGTRPGLVMTPRSGIGGSQPGKRPGLQRRSLPRMHRRERT